MKFKNWNCKVHKGTYPNGRTAIQLYDAEIGDPIATATVNIPDEPLPDNHVFIKNWSENEGILDSLVEADYVKPTGRTVNTGYVTAIEAELL